MGRVIDCMVCGEGFPSHEEAFKHRIDEHVSSAEVDYDEKEIRFTDDDVEFRDVLIEEALRKQEDKKENKL